VPKKRRKMSGDGKGATCHYCVRRLESSTSKGPVAATRDHFHPKSLGGEFRVWCCRRCNEIKRDMTVPEWRRFMRKNPEWWKMPAPRQTFADRREAAMQVQRPALPSDHQ
jgi:5-methylcytosine-specific restriction endonuclease McrA